MTHWPVKSRRAPMLASTLALAIVATLSFTACKRTPSPASEASSASRSNQARVEPRRNV
jgi:hypothetical protein